MNDIEERLTHTFKTVAEHTTTESDWNRVVRGADSAAFASSPLRPRVLVIAAMLAIVIGAGAFVVNGRDDDTVDVTSENPFVLPGEEILSLDPLTVRPAPTPEANFDTSGLGTEVVFEPFTEITAETQELIDVATTLGGERSITKITQLGNIDGTPYVHLVTDGVQEWFDDPVNLRMSTIVGDTLDQADNGGGWDADPTSTEIIHYPTDFSDTWVSRIAPVGNVVWRVTADTAVVSFVSDDTRLWTRPSGGNAIFATAFDNGEAFTVQALDVDGSVIGEYSDTVRYGEGDEFGMPMTSPQIGDGFFIAGVDDADGKLKTVQPDGSPLVLLFGATWCLPCQAVAEAGLPLVDALDPSVRVLLVPSFMQPDQTWPTDPAWDQPRIRLYNPERTQEVPAILVLDGDGIVESYEVGVDGVLEALGSVNDLVEN